MILPRDDDNGKEKAKISFLTLKKATLSKMCRQSSISM